MVSGTITTAANAAIGLVSYPVYLHFLGLDRYGLWVLLGTVIGFAQMGNLGLAQAVMNFTATEASRAEWKAVESLVSTAVALLMGLGALVIAGMFAVSDVLADTFGLLGEHRLLFIDLVPYATGLSFYVLVVQVYAGMLSGLGRMDRSNGLNVASRLVALGVSAWMLWSGVGVVGLLVGNGASQVLLHVAMRREVGALAPVGHFRANAVTVASAKRLLGFGATLSGGQVVGMLFQPFNKIMVSRYMGLESVTALELAYSGSMQIRGLIQSAFIALIPEIGKWEVRPPAERASRLRQLRRRSLAAVVALGVPIIGAIGVWAPQLLQMWLRGRYSEDLVGIFRLAMLAAFFGLLGVPAYYLLLGLNKVRPVAAAHVVQAMVSFSVVSGIAVGYGSLSLNSVGLALLAGAASATALLLVSERAHIRSAAKA